MYYFSGDMKHFSYYKKADPIKHPAMCRDMSDYFDLPADFLIRRERSVFAEQTPMIVDDLIECAVHHNMVIFDGIMDMEYTSKRAHKNRVIYFDIAMDIRKRDFFRREDHIHMLENIRSNPKLSNEEKERRINLRRTVAISSYDYDAQKYGVMQFTRNCETSREEMLAFTERHFELCLAEQY
jgi:hypothetical protein